MGDVITTYNLFADVKNGILACPTHLYTDALLGGLTRAGYLEDSIPNLRLTEKGNTTLKMLTELLEVQEDVYRVEHNLPRLHRGNDSLTPTSK